LAILLSIHRSSLHTIDSNDLVNTNAPLKPVGNVFSSPAVKCRPLSGHRNLLGKIQGHSG
jgi:hypothetical protein